MLTSIINRMPRGVAVAGLLLATAACDDPFSPYWDSGRYDLRFANNRYVPAVVSQGPGSAYTEVRGGTLVLRRDHSYQLVVLVREQSGGQLYEYSKVFVGEYETDHRTLYLTYFLEGDPYSSVMVAAWRDGWLELVVPDVDGYADVLCRFED